ncbi:PEP-CTERM sorting domain-containing protein [Paracoccus sp. (in: a-proteobacteria)]|uniref:PEP-CTERM sorting domain-containing protein n=1 Tax=Paracoccus sp. TaxID=267 RepID=UPI0026DF0DAD|nr:PEP-CTERM sorting domain-containing protein [Paracoccus sp. (in: a-proteobacteria)]MDO5647772.1 hypothetical protein [Paracoccus sp. (in: a-proteobacteria)]
MHVNLKAITVAAAALMAATAAHSAVVDIETQIVAYDDMALMSRVIDQSGNYTLSFAALDTDTPIPDPMGYKVWRIVDHSDNLRRIINSLFDQADTPMSHGHSVDLGHIEAGVRFVALALADYTGFSMTLNYVEPDAPQPAPVPLPATLPLLAGALGLAGVALRRRNG